MPKFNKNCLAVICTSLQSRLTGYIKIHLTYIMQMLQQAFKIEDSEKKESLLEILSDKYCRIIIESIMDKPKSAIEIVSETKIPVSTVYRRIQMLSDNKLLRISGNISEDGKKSFLYKSKVKGIQTKYENGSVNVELILNREN